MASRQMSRAASRAFGRLGAALAARTGTALAPHWSYGFGQAVLRAIPIWAVGLYIVQQLNKPEIGGNTPNMDGWTQRNRCDPRDSFGRGTVESLMDDCLINQAAKPPTNISAGSTRMMMLRMYYTGVEAVPVRSMTTSTWDRHVGGVAPWWWSPVGYRGIAIPAIDPFSQPVRDRKAVPIPLPYPLIPHVRANPFRSPTEQSQRGNATPLTIAHTQPIHGIPGRGWIVTGRGVIPIPGGSVVPRPGVGPVPVTHPLPKPPPAKTKEHKLRLTLKPGNVALRIVNLATESFDVINALHDALDPKCQAQAVRIVPFNEMFGQGIRFRSPEHERNIEKLREGRSTRYAVQVMPNGWRKYTKRDPAVVKAARIVRGRAGVGSLTHRPPTMQERLGALYQHMGEECFDLRKAMANLVENQIEDAIFGGLGRLTARANRKAGKSGGFQLGPAL